MSRPDGSDFNRPSPFVVDREQSSNSMKQQGETAPPVLPRSDSAVDITGATRANLTEGGLQRQIAQWESTTEKL